MTQNIRQFDIDRAPHYQNDSDDTQCIDVAEKFNFCRGNAIKYIWRAGKKDDELQDLYKAKWYIEREISRLESLRSRLPRAGTIQPESGDPE